MADIVQLQENGVPQYLMTHVDAVEGLDETLEALEEKQVASITPASGWTQYTTDPNKTGHPMIEACGNSVVLSGALKNNDVISAAGESQMCTLPEWAWPSKQVIRVNQASGTNIYTIEITPTGEMWLKRHRGGIGSGFGEKEVGAGAWINIGCSFLRVAQ